MRESERERVRERVREREREKLTHGNYYNLQTSVTLFIFDLRVWTIENNYLHLRYDSAPFVLKHCRTVYSVYMGRLLA